MDYGLVDVAVLALAVLFLMYLAYTALQMHFRAVSERLSENQPVIIYIDTSSPNRTVIKVSRVS